MKRTLFAATCLAMLLASCGGNSLGWATSVSGVKENVPGYARGLRRELQDEEPEAEDEPEDEAPATEPDVAAVGRAAVARDRIARQAADVRRLVGGSPPVETAAELDRRAREMDSRLDSLWLTALIVDYDNAIYQDYMASVECSGSRCVTTFPSSTGISPDTIDLSDPSTFRSGDTLLTRNGITIEQLAYLDDDGDPVEAIWSTLHDSGFGSSLIHIEGNYPLSLRRSGASGDLTGSAPSVSAIWRGMATAVTKQNDDLLLGDAELRYAVSAAGGSLEATLGAFVNVTEARATTPLAIFFDDIQVRSDGTFNFRGSIIGSTSAKLQGAFYGNAHAEAAGVFEHSIPDGSGNLLDLLGAFGTKRQSQ